jgi:hypothetical protein
MVQKTLSPTAMLAILATIDPNRHAVAVYNSPWVSLADFAAVAAIVQTGTLGTAATIDAKLEQATDSAGANAKDVEGAVISQLTKAADDDKQAIIECWGEDLDLKAEFTHVRLSVEVAGDTSDFGAVLLGCTPRYGPASDSNVDTVSEIAAAG